VAGSDYTNVIDKGARVMLHDDNCELVATKDSAMDQTCHCAARAWEADPLPGTPRKPADAQKVPGSRSSRGILSPTSSAWADMQIPPGQMNQARDAS